MADKQTNLTLNGYMERKKKIDEDYVGAVIRKREHTKLTEELDAEWAASAHNPDSGATQQQQPQQQPQQQMDPAQLHAYQAAAAYAQNYDKHLGRNNEVLKEVLVAAGLVDDGFRGTENEVLDNNVLHKVYRELQKRSEKMDTSLIGSRADFREAAEAIVKEVTGKAAPKTAKTANKPKAQVANKPAAAESTSLAAPDSQDVDIGASNTIPIENTGDPDHDRGVQGLRRMAADDHSLGIDEVPYIIDVLNDPEVDQSALTRFKGKPNLAEFALPGALEVNLTTA